MWNPIKEQLGHLDHCTFRDDVTLHWGLQDICTNMSYALTCHMHWSRSVLTPTWTQRPNQSRPTRWQTNLYSVRFEEWNLKTWSAGKFPEVTKIQYIVKWYFYSPFAFFIETANEKEFLELLAFIKYLQYYCNGKEVTHKTEWRELKTDAQYFRAVFDHISVLLYG